MKIVLNLVDNISMSSVADFKNELEDWLCEVDYDEDTVKTVEVVR